MSDQIVPGSTIREARFRLQAYSGLYQGNALGEAPVVVDHRKPYFSNNSTYWIPMYVCKWIDFLLNYYIHDR